MLSVVIPVLNEAETIISVLCHLTENASEANIAEIIIVDGGSTDQTQQLVKTFAQTASFNVLLISSEKGRAKQMNTGASHATGSILYFLHADSFPPEAYDKHILSEVNKGNEAGCFRMRFDSSHWWLQLAGWLTKFNWRACRGGDQSQFITQKLFNEIGGYDETYVIYEDNILINELYARKQFVVIPHWLTSSARRYLEHGVWRLQYHFWAIYVKRWMGADAQTLYSYYCKHIRNSKQLLPSNIEVATPSEVMADE